MRLTSEISTSDLSAAFPLRLLLLLSAYGACLCLLSAKLSLWLDEIIDLKGIRDHDIHALLAWIPTNAGAVPLDYLIRAATIHLLGYSAFASRLPSVLWSVLAGAGVFALARKMNLRSPFLAVLTFCLLPLQLRYALEARPYSQGLALSLWSTNVFLSLVSNPTASKATVYGLIALAGLYTQPYVLFVVFAHLAWLCVSELQGKSRLLIWASVPVVLAALAFLPWYLWAASRWRESAESFHHAIGLRAALLIARELIAAGYFGTSLVALLIVLGLKASGVPLPGRSFWLLYLLLPLFLAVLADFLFGYFLAIRQMIFIVAPLSLLAVVGIEKLASNGRNFAALAMSLLIATFLISDFRFLTKPRENWEAASAILDTLSKQGSCVIFVPGDSVRLYEFFAPAIETHTCRTVSVEEQSVAVAISPYDATIKREPLSSSLPAGFAKVDELNPTGPRIEVYRRK